MDQSGFDNQHQDWVSASEAARLLGVKRATVYAYASRGRVQSVPGERGKARRYLRSDLERLLAGADARRGHGAVAAGALRWGEPVLDSSVTEITPSGPRYRGEDAVGLARAGASFERVAGLLWEAPDVARPFGPVRLGVSSRSLRALLPSDASPLAVMQLVVPALGAADPDRFGAALPAELTRARRLIFRLAACLGLPSGREGNALARATVAEAALVGLGRAAGRDAVAAIDAALVVLADHELNVSTFVARVTASAGADLYACLAAALGAASGPRHGGACDRVEALLDEIARPERARAVLVERARRGDEIPGFGHRLYPSGDPRARLLLELAATRGRRSPRVRCALAAVETMRAIGHPPPAVDLGLVALCDALGLPRGSAAGLFSLGRTAGWVAHVLEQRTQPVLLRPRARYVARQATP